MVCINVNYNFCLNELLAHLAVRHLDVVNSNLYLISMWCANIKSGDFSGLYQRELDHFCRQLVTAFRKSG